MTDPARRVSAKFILDMEKAENILNKAFKNLTKKDSGLTKKEKNFLTRVLDNKEPLNVNSEPKLTLELNILSQYYQNKKKQ